MEETLKAMWLERLLIVKIAIFSLLPLAPCVRKWSSETINTGLSTMASVQAWMSVLAENRHSRMRRERQVCPKNRRCRFRQLATNSRPSSIERQTAVCAESGRKVAQRVWIANDVDCCNSAIADVKRGRLEHIATINTDIAGQAIDRRCPQKRRHRFVLASQPSEQAKRSINPAYDIAERRSPCPRHWNEFRRRAPATLIMLRRHHLARQRRKKARAIRSASLASIVKRGRAC